MADLKINPRFLETLQRSAGAQIAQKVAQQFSPKTILDIQRVLQASDFLSGALGIGGIENLPQPLLGGVTLSKARDIYKQLSEARIARKNLFFIHVVDDNPPDLGISPRAAASPGGDTLAGRLDAARNAVSSAVSGGLGGIIAGALGSAASPSTNGDDPSTSFLFNMFATNVSYGGNTMTGERTHFGAVSADRITGTEPVDLQITTMDDEVGTLKRWFDGKFKQAAHDDGTFGLPGEYCVEFHIYQAVPERDERAYKFYGVMRPQSIQHDLSRGDQAMQEIQMTFQQFDTFYTP
jgi:hypothetical protein